MEDKPVYPSDLADKVLVRMPDGMRDKLKALAKTNNRTLNAEIIARLQNSFENRLLSQEQLSIIEDGAKVLGYTPNTEKFEQAVSAMATEVQEAAAKEADESIKSMLKLVFIQREHPEAFERLIDSGIKAGIVDPEFKGKLLVPKALKNKS